MAFNKEVEKEGTGNNPIELEYKLTCDKDYTVEATLSPATASSWVSIVGGGNKEGVFEINISKNDGSSRNVSVYPRIYNNEHKLVSECTSKGVFISQKGDGGSSECSFEITITNPSGGRFETCDAGTLSFDYVKKGESPTPEPTDCPSGNWSVTQSDNDILTVLNKAIGCTADKDMGNNDWKPGGNTTIYIKNESTLYYIPFSGKLKINGQYYHYRQPTTDSYPTYYWYYGYKTTQGFDTNFLIPPLTTATLTNCRAGANDGSGTYFAINVLKTSGSYQLHSDELSQTGELSFNSSTNTFTVPQSIDNGTTRWRKDGSHYAFKLEEITGSTHCSSFKYTGGQRIIPVHLNISGANWSAIEAALRNKNNNGYYPYTITPNS